MLSSGDCFVAAMGFEERALAGLKRACEASQDFHVALIRYLPKWMKTKKRRFWHSVKRAA